MLEKKISFFLTALLFLSGNYFISSYPIFTTILIVSIPLTEENFQTNNNIFYSRVENNYLRWLQASGADLVVIHPWSTSEEIDLLMKKVNGVILQGNPNPLDITSSYYKTIKIIYQKIMILNEKGIKMPLLAIGDDVSLLGTIINEDKFSTVTIPKTKIKNPSNINLYLSIDKTTIFKEFEQREIRILEEYNILPNNINSFISVKTFISESHLSQLNIVATSKSNEGQEYIAIAEGKKFPLIMLSFHPEYVAYEDNDFLIVPNSIQAIYTSRFIANSFVFYGKKNVNNIFTVEEKEKFDYIDPYGENPKLIYGRFNYLFKNPK